MKQIIGILGGMGPEATLFFYNQIVQQTKSDRDNDHIPAIIYSNPKIPDRTEAIINKGPSPLPLLMEGAKFLEAARVSVIVMPCITAHHFYPEIIKNLKTPFLHIIEETLAYLDNTFPELKKLGLLATSGTIKTEIFQNSFEKKGKTIVVPDKNLQSKLTDAIYSKNGIKAGYKNEPKKRILQVVKHLMEKNAQAIIAGCTEVPLVLNSNDTTVSFIEPMTILAKKTIKTMGYPVKNR